MKSFLNFFKKMILNILFFGSVFSFCSCSVNAPIDDKNVLPSKVTVDFTIANKNKTIDFAYNRITYELFLRFNTNVLFKDLEISTDKNDFVNIYPVHDYQGLYPELPCYSYYFKVKEACGVITFKIKYHEFESVASINSKTNETHSSVLFCRKDPYHGLTEQFTLVTSYEDYSSHYYAWEPISDSYFENNDVLAVLGYVAADYVRLNISPVFIYDSTLYIQVEEITSSPEKYFSYDEFSFIAIWFLIPKGIDADYQYTAFIRRS